MRTRTTYALFLTRVEFVPARDYNSIVIMLVIGNGR